ncbi:uncharacterized protein LOC132197322 [Neocloeon triangulifer]|uniref:uncharacterized protein LOC132197322 n=1 Tax=Neocloeon triangulifer TaxID=2078957 RepID=UPI00286F88D3|nr:uncharacterized protein LOC132197322 [Neocloeon triangulifer]
MEDKPQDEPQEKFEALLAERRTIHELKMKVRRSKKQEDEIVADNIRRQKVVDMQKKSVTEENLKLDKGQEEWKAHEQDVQHKIQAAQLPEREKKAKEEMRQVIAAEIELKGRIQEANANRDARVQRALRAEDEDDDEEFYEFYN